MKCPKCDSEDTDFTACSHCNGTGGHESGNGWDEPRAWDLCDDCGGMGGEYVCYACDHTWEQEPTDGQIRDRIEASYDRYCD